MREPMCRGYTCEPMCQEHFHAVHLLGRTFDQSHLLIKCIISGAAHCRP